MATILACCGYFPMVACQAVDSDEEPVQAVGEPANQSRVSEQRELGLPEGCYWKLNKAGNLSPYCPDPEPPPPPPLQ